MKFFGTTIFVLFIIHNAFNFKWYMTLFKGKHDLRRNFHILINALLLVAMILTIISGVMMSRSLYTFVNFGKAALARRMHLIANSWTLVLVSIHLGMHLTPMTSKIRTKLQASRIKYAVYVILVLFVILGIYLFIKAGFFQDMFGITSFKFMDTEENPVVFYLKQLDISLTIALVTHWLWNVKSARRKYEKTR